MKQYVRDEVILRTEPATNDVTDYGVGKAMENLPELTISNVQQDILESFVDREHLWNLSQPSRLLPEGYRLSVVLLKLFHKLYAPLSSGLLEPFPADRNFPPQRTQQLDKLYRAVSDSLDQLVDGLGLKAA